MKASNPRSYRWLLWVLAIVGANLDQMTKYLVFPWLYRTGLDDHKGGLYYELIPGAFRFRVAFSNESDPGGELLSPLRSLNGDKLPAVNHGALFGLGDDYARTANLVFTLVSLVAAGAIIYWSFRRSTARDGCLCTALGLILAGTVGNLFDRVVFGGVRDFLFWHGGFEWPVFNMADCCLVCGASLLLLQAFWARSPVAQPEQAVASPAAAAR